MRASNFLRSCIRCYRQVGTEQAALLSLPLPRFITARHGVRLLLSAGCSACSVPDTAQYDSSPAGVLLFGWRWSCAVQTGKHAHALKPLVVGEERKLAPFSDIRPLPRAELASNSFQILWSSRLPRAGFCTHSESKENPLFADTKFLRRY